MLPDSWRRSAGGLGRFAQRARASGVRRRWPRLLPRGRNEQSLSSPASVMTRRKSRVTGCIAFVDRRWGRVRAVDRLTSTDPGASPDMVASGCRRRSQPMGPARRKMGDPLARRQRQGWLAFPGLATRCFALWLRPSVLDRADTGRYRESIVQGIAVLNRLVVYAGGPASVHGLMVFLAPRAAGRGVDTYPDKATWAQTHPASPGLFTSFELRRRSRPEDPGYHKQP